jgi:hypothetical protein
MTFDAADLIRQAEKLEAAALQTSDLDVRDGYRALARTLRQIAAPATIATIPDEEIERMAERMTGLSSKL